VRGVVLHTTGVVVGATITVKGWLLGEEGYDTPASRGELFLRHGGRR
jgi:hypothetical protein